MVVVQPLLTPDDVVGMIEKGELDPHTGQFELVDGEIIWLGFPNLNHNLVVGAIYVLLVQFAKEIDGIAFVDGAGFIVGPQSRNLRGPDVALVTNERRHTVPDDGKWGEAAPDLAVEVLSREQHGEAYARQKVPEYLGSGGKIVWLVDPDKRTIRVYEVDQPRFRIYSGDSEITLDQIAPGFRAPISSFFPN